jgi:D-lyxose ketol-isomerase
MPGGRILLCETSPMRQDSVIWSFGKQVEFLLSIGKPVLRHVALDPYHARRGEISIMRGGKGIGRLFGAFYGLAEYGRLVQSTIFVACAGAARHIEPYGILIHSPGEPKTMRFLLRHIPHAVGGNELTGGISYFNECACDWCFLVPRPRLAGMVEDQAPPRVLCNEYRRLGR